MTRQKRREETQDGNDHKRERDGSEASEDQRKSKASLGPALQKIIKETNGSQQSRCQGAPALVNSTRFGSAAIHRFSAVFPPFSSLRGHVCDPIAAMFPACLRRRGRFVWWVARASALVPPPTRSLSQLAWFCTLNQNQGRGMGRSTGWMDLRPRSARRSRPRGRPGCRRTRFRRERACPGRSATTASPNSRCCPACVCAIAQARRPASRLMLSALG